MEVNYRSKIFLLVLGLLCTGLSIAEIYDKGLMLFDYEGFDPIVCFWLVLGPILLYEYFFKPRFELTTDSIIVKKSREINIPYDEILGISILSNFMKIVMKDGKSHKLSLTSVKNRKEVKDFLFKEKQLSKLSFYASLTIPTIIEFGFIAFTLVMFVFMINGKKNEFKSKLPLLSIQVEEIEGILSKESEIKVLRFSDRNSTLVSGGISLYEFPETVFAYRVRDSKLKDKTLLYQDELTSIDKGTKVKLKIRKGDYKKLISNSTAKKNGDSNSQETTTITFYSLQVGDVITMEKEHLK